MCQKPCCNKDSGLSFNEMIKTFQPALSQVSSKDEIWNRRRAEADRVATLYQGTRHDPYFLRMNECSGRLVFKAVIDPASGEVSYRLAACWFCRVRLCPVCQWRRTLFLMAKAFQIIPKIRADYPTHHWLFLTLTVKNPHVNDLRKTLDEMNKAWGRMLKLSPICKLINPVNRPKSSLKKKEYSIIIDGFIKSVEVTRECEEDENGKFIRFTDTDNVHPHFHILLMVKPSYFGHDYIRQEEWTELWRKALRVDYTPIVDIRKVKPKKVKKIKRKNDPIGMTDAVRETMKYSVKSKDITTSTGDIERDKQFLVSLTNQLYKRKMLATGGICKKYFEEWADEQVLEKADLVHITNEGELVEDLPDDAPKIAFDWFSDIGQYLQVIDQDNEWESLQHSVN